MPATLAGLAINQKKVSLELKNKYEYAIKDRELQLEELNKIAYNSEKGYDEKVNINLGITGFTKKIDGKSCSLKEYEN